MLHNELNRRSALAAGKTFADIFCGGNIERRTAVFMKRTQADIVHTSLFKRNKVGHNICNMCRFINLINGKPVYHFLLISRKINHLFWELKKYITSGGDSNYLNFPVNGIRERPRKVTQRICTTCCKAGNLSGNTVNIILYAVTGYIPNRNLRLSASSASFAFQKNTQMTQINADVILFAV
jgi:hypothetical protein